MIRALSSLCLVATLLFLGATATAQGKSGKVAILGLEVANTNIDAETTRVATELTRELRNQPKAGKGPYSLAPNSEKELLDEKLMNSCENEEKSCMATIGGNMKADYLIWGKVEKKSQGQQSGYQVRLTLLKVASPNGQAPSHTDFIPATEAKDAAKMAEWGRKFYARLTNAEDTRLVIRANIDRGTILVDGKERGNITSGQGELTDLPPGRYKISVVAEGYQRWESSEAVTVRPGEETLEVNMSKLGGSAPCDPAVSKDCGGTVSASGGGRGFWKAMFVGGLVVAAGGGALTFVSNSAFKDFEEACQKMPPSDSRCDGGKAAEDRTSQLETRANLGWGVVGLGVVVAGVGLYKGFLSGGTEQRPVAARARKSRSGVAVTPVLGPQGAGATLRFDW